MSNIRKIEYLQKVRDSSCFGRYFPSFSEIVDGLNIGHSSGLTSYYGLVNWIDVFRILPAGRR